MGIGGSVVPMYLIDDVHQLFTIRDLFVDRVFQSSLLTQAYTASSH